MPERTATESRQAINARAWEWDRTHTKQFKIKLNMNTDADIIAHLEAQQNTQGYIKALIRADIERKNAETKEAKPVKSISFEAGEGRHFPGGVNFMISADRTIYAEVSVPDGATDDYGYLTMRNAILAAYKGTDALKFFYDDSAILEPDAAADCEVYLDIEEED